MSFCLEGSYRFQLVVRAPVAAKGVGAVEITAELSRKWLGLIPYKAEIPDPPRRSFALA
jgi:hypothetical protein